MRLTRLIIYGFILAAVIAYIFFVEHGYKQQKQAEETESAKFVRDDMEQVSKIELSSPSIGAIELIKPASDWVMLRPIKAKADEYAVKSVLKTIFEAAPERTITEKDVKWSDYGLDKPLLTVTIRMQEGKKYEMIFGAHNPSKSSYYMKLDGSPKLFLVADTLRNALDKTSFDLRDKTIMSFAPSDIDNVIIEKKGVQNEFRREGVDQWEMITPQKFKVKNVVISTLLRKLSNLSALEIYDNTEDGPEAFGFMSPTDRISIYGKGINQTLYIGSQIKPQTDSSLKKGDYVRVEGSDTVYVINDPSITDFKLDADLLQDKSLISLNILETNSIEILLDGKKWLLTKSPDKKWSLDEPEKVSPIKDWSVTGILWKLRDLNYVSLISPIPNELEGLGLSEPRVVITLNGKDSSNTKTLKIGWPKETGNKNHQNPSDGQKETQEEKNDDKTTIESGEMEAPSVINVTVEPNQYPNTIFQVPGEFVKGLWEDLNTLIVK